MQLNVRRLFYEMRVFKSETAILSFPLECKLHAIILFKEQQSSWRPEDQERYSRLIKQCDTSAFTR